MRGFKQLFFFFFSCIIVQTHAQTSCPPPNIGFEEGTFNHWQCDTGSFNGSGVLHLVPTLPIDSWHTMIDKNTIPQLDYFGGFPTLCPNGSGHSIILGRQENEVPRNAEAESISYTFNIPVDAPKYSLTLNYAVVIHVSGFPDNLKPSFSIKVYDVTDQVYIDCATSIFLARPNLPPWKTALPNSPIQPSDRVYYQDWTALAINLNGYAGKTLRLEFLTHHSGATYHGKLQTISDFAYAYVDVNEDCSTFITGNSYCTGQDHVTLTAPPGYSSYFWYKGDDPNTVISTSPVLVLSPPPPDQTQYNLRIFSVHDGSGCADVLTTIVNKVGAGFNFKVKENLYICPTNAADLTAPSVLAGSDAGLKFSYYKDAANTLLVDNPQSVTEAGTYYIRASNADGCIDVLPINVSVVDQALIKVTDPPAVTYPATVDISNSVPANNNFTYTFYSDSIATTPIQDIHHISQSGTYYIEALNTTTASCTTILPVHVVVNPPAPPVVKAPNAFTPNGDEINDRFFMTIIGYDSFSSLKIYNRNGQLMFQTKSADGYWDGTYNGKPANVGTYYWIFNGIDLYYQRPVIQSGSVTLIR
jgi:gliding motility-associated-like protein